MTSMRSTVADVVSSANIPELSADFELLLPGTSSGPEELQRYLGSSPAWVHVEYERVSRTLLRFAQAVVDAMESPRCAHSFLQRLDLRSVSRDHNWRRIFAEIVDLDLCFDGHKRALLTRYLQFLSERKRLLAYVEAQHAGLEITADHGWVAPLDVPESTPLAMGETGLLVLEAGTVLPLWMANVGFSVELNTNGAVLLKETGGFERALRLGRNVVGRHPECDIVIPSKWRTVSRVHAILDWEREHPDDPTNGSCWAASFEESSTHQAAQRGLLRVTNLSSRQMVIVQG
ncbi:MAG: hypothetical protein ACI9W2_004812 [Gammaproteobacteria bacterium]|jgi:hypothetical protein